MSRSTGSRLFIVLISALSAAAAGVEPATVVQRGADFGLRRH